MRHDSKEQGDLLRLSQQPPPRSCSSETSKTSSAQEKAALAYEVLKDAARRTDYDAELARRQIDARPALRF
jgi:hypothetical protein